MPYINSTGIALIVGLLGRARGADLPVTARALTDHYREIFEITRLSDFMTIEAGRSGPGGEHDMTETTVSMTVRTPTERASVIDIAGEVTAASEGALMDAYGRASGEHTRWVVLNFSELEYMNSSGIGLLVTLLVRANRQKQRLLAFGLTDHYLQIFQLTRLDEAIAIHGSESEAIAAAA